MFDIAEPLSLPRIEVYPERQVPRQTGLERWVALRAAGLTANLTRTRALRFRDIVARARDAAPGAGITDADLRAQSAALSWRLRTGSWPPRSDLLAESFALVREAARRVLGTPHFDVQIQGGAALVAGMLAEMETGEGKTLTATLAAVTAGLAGVPVHLVTSNDYLAERDAKEMGPLYKFFGLTVGTVVHGVEQQKRRAAYRSDITYCCNKEAAFDYLRDRVLLRERSNSLQLRVEQLLTDTPRSANLVHRGLYFAIIDEADSVLIDEARIPLIISRTVKPDAQAEDAYRRALDLARSLTQDREFKLHRSVEQIELTEDGRERIAEASDVWGGTWSVPVIREDLVRKALTAIHTLKRDKNYLVKAGKVSIVDEYTGRLMPDRSWSEGLHQLIELKEGVELTEAKETLARMTYQRFFRRYRWLSGMTGTARPVAQEMLATYRLPVVTIPTNRPTQRQIGRSQVFSTADQKWRAVADRVAAIHATGAPVLIGTRSVEASNDAAKRLSALGLSFSVLNADQDAEEATIVSDAGRRGAITVATNMAGRGTDIKLGPGVEDLGGLHVLMTERHDSARIDRQLAGRSARQGQPGRVEVFLSMEDELLTQLDSWSPAKLARLGGKRRFFDAAQRTAERRHAAMRRELMRIDNMLGDVLAFTGQQE